MITQNSITDILQVVLSAPVTTNQLSCFYSFSITNGSTFTPDKTGIATNNTTPVTLCGAPASGYSILGDHLSVFNTDTANATVTIKMNLNGTDIILQKVTLGPGEKTEYNNGKGWQTFTSAGALKSSLNQGLNATSSTLSAAVLANDVINNNAVANTIQDITGLSFPVVAGNKYYFKFLIQYTSAATTTGSRFSINGPSVSALRYRSEYSLTATTQTLNEGLTAYDLPAASNATSAATGSNIALIEGFIEPSANGTVIARFASEVLSSAITAKAGSIVYFQQVI